MAFDLSKIEKIVQPARTYGAKRLILSGSAMDTPRTARDGHIACDGVRGGSSSNWQRKLRRIGHPF